MYRFIFFNLSPPRVDASSGSPATDLFPAKKNWILRFILPKDRFINTFLERKKIGQTEKKP